MRILYSLLFSLLPFISFAQEQNSLLWEISGNDLKESSYLYGTMHVSKKIAFRLDDVFYEALDKSKVVALESDPSTWLDDEDNMRNMAYTYGRGNVTKGFYAHSFQFKNPKKENIASYLAFEDRIINNILYRTNEYSQNFEEDTYLDMFIYQAGQKFGKPIVALEDLEESSTLVGRASLNAVKQKPDEWLQKKMKQQDPMFLLQDAYRERNINLLDSIDQAMYTEHYLKNMLYIRNENMAKRLDSVMHGTTVFTGIGAAHLPGKKGVISLLREMGYTVTPLVSKTTSKGNTIKTKFENKIRKNTYKVRSTDDQFFSLLLPNKLYPIADQGATTYISPDLANGSYLMINRVPKYEFLKKETSYSIADIDQLLFENIPGKIVEKKTIDLNGFKGLDIKNLLKNGDHQRYHIYVTPLEIIIFKMGGEGDYVTRHSDTIFNSITFRSLKKSPIKVVSGYDDFEVQMPALYTFPNKFRNGSRTIEGYDPNTDSYYFLRKVTINDFNFIEEDSFELKQIQKRFYQDLKLKGDYNFPKGNSMTSEALFDSVSQKRLHLKTLFRRGNYYLLGTLTKDPTLASTFFNSLKVKNTVLKKAFKQIRDSALYFSTVTSVKPPKFVENSNNRYNNQKKPKPYAAYNKRTVYQNKNNEAITVVLNKSHDYLMLQNIDSVWALRKRIYATKNFNIQQEKIRTAKGYHELQLTLTDTASTRGILIKNIVKGGLLYEVKAMVDTIHKPSRFVQEFFDNFTPKDTLIGKDILKDKTSDFFRALKDNDSIVLSGHRFLKFEEKHIDSLKHYIATFDFKDDKKNIQANLIQKLGKMDTPEVISFFKDFYVTSYNNSYAQTKILQAISKKSDEASVSLLLDLMSKDLPLVSRKFEIHTIFKAYKDSLQLGKKLYPEILEYSAIEEYKPSIFSLLAQLKSKGLVKPKLYKNYRKQILNDAKIQLKRQLGQYVNPNAQRRFISTAQRQNNAILEDYVILLYPFIKEKGVKQFFNRLQFLKNPSIRTTYVALLAEGHMDIPQGMIDSLAQDINSRMLLFNKLKSVGKSNLFPAAHRSQEALAACNLFAGMEFNKAKDSIVFLKKKQLKYQGKSYTGFYFKTRNTAREYDKNFKMRLVVFENGKGIHSRPYYKNAGMRIEDTETDAEVMEYVTEAFLLKKRKRATVYKPNQYNAYGYYDY